MTASNAETFPVITIIINMFMQLLLLFINTETLELLISNRRHVNPVGQVGKQFEGNAVDNLTPRGLSAADK